MWQQWIEQVLWYLTGNSACFSLSEKKLYPDQYGTDDDENNLCNSLMNYSLC